MKTRPDGIFWLTLFWILGILSSRVFNFPAATLLISIGVLVCIAYFFQSIRIILLFLIVFLLAQLHFHTYNQTESDTIETIFQTKNEITQPIEGQIVSELVKREKNYRFLLEIHTINDVSASGRIYFYTKNDSLRYGDIIQIVAQIQPFAETSNPYSFDFNEFMQLKKISGSGFSKTPITVSSSQPKLLQSLIISTRKWLRERIEHRFGRESGFFKAILIGDKSDIDELSSRLNRAGLSHLLAVSGLHVGIIAFVFYLLLKILLGNRNLVRLILMILLLFYAAICNWSPSVTRAMIMISLLLLAKMIQRKTNANNIIAASLLIITIINPNQLFSVGLQLSYIAVFTLINLVPYIRLWKSKNEDSRTLKSIKNLSHAIFLIMFSSFILSVILAPLTLYHFNQFNLNGIIANIIAIPMMTLILPLAILTVFLPAGIAAIYLSALQLLIFLFDRWTVVTADLPMHFTFIRFSTIQFFLALIIIISIPFFTRKKKLQFILLAFFMGNIAYSFLAFSSDKLLITFFDCGLGDMFLVETAENETILIDTGPPDFSRGHFSQSALGYFQKQGIPTIDWLIVTHAHNDHYGGLEFILKEMNVNHLVVTNHFQNRSIWHFFQPLLEDRTSVFTVQDTLFLPLKNVSMKVLHPDENFYHQNINNMSIVVKLEYGDMNILFSGDAEEEVEEKLILDYPEYLPSKVLKAGHHGSKTSSCEAFIKAVSPNYVFISTSLKNRFHFPHEITLQKYEFLQDKMFIAGLDGALQIETDGITGTLQTFRSKKIYFEKKQSEKEQ